MNKLLLFLIALLLSTSFRGNTTQNLKLTPTEIESIFLKQNLTLIAEQMNISIADAEIAQAKLWDNPTLSFNDINLWSSRSQREGESEVIPPLLALLQKTLNSLSS